MPVGKANNAPSAKGAQFGADPKAVLLCAVDTASGNAYPLQMTGSTGSVLVSPTGATPTAAATVTKAVPNTALVLATADATRSSIAFYNADLVNTIYVGNVVGVTTTTGFPIVPGGYVTRDAESGSKLAWWGIAAVAGPSTLYVETVS